MIDFLIVSTRPGKKGVTEVFPKFVIKKSSDLMIRGGDFYAIWMEEQGLWSIDEQDVIMLVDQAVDEVASELKGKTDDQIKPLHMWDSNSGIIDIWHKYCQRQMRDNFHMLDEKLIFSNTVTKKKDYASKKLSYPLESGETNAWDRFMTVLYSKEERHKIEWAIGSIVSGDSRKLHKFMVLYGAAGTGKSTILNVIQQLFDGYTSVFDARALGSSSNSFALEAFKSNPLVAIQHDGDLSKIEDNTRLNSLVSHELMTVNEKFKSTYENRFKCFLFMGTNKPVKITDAKSGLIRRLVDVSPTGDKIPTKEYRALTKQIAFELGPIAYRCQEVYLDNPAAYDDYIPRGMLGASNDFYNFVLDSWYIFKKEDVVGFKSAWEMYKTYCDEAKVPYPFSQRAFREELKNYFREYNERVTLNDGTRLRSQYSGFRSEKFEEEAIMTHEDEPEFAQFVRQESIFDKEGADYTAQYASEAETPLQRWDSVRTKLRELDTSRLHYVLVPENHIVIDFDIKDQTGEKNFNRNLEAALKWPPTYAEVSKSGKGIHLHYLYTGDVSKLSRVFDDYIEIKIFSGKSSLRRQLTLCNNLPIASISSGLPLKEESKTIDIKVLRDEKDLRTMIKKNLNKEIHASTKPSMDFIHHLLEEAYASGMHYDVSNLRSSILSFAAGSTNQSDYCMRLVGRMKFKSDEPAPTQSDRKQSRERYTFFDVEVFSNLVIVCWKLEGKENPVIKLINPKQVDIEALIQMKLVGFNCRRYDNHILYAILMGYNTPQVYNLSQRIIAGDKQAFFGEGYGLSETDVFDFSSLKQSLKKFEIDLHFQHQELGLRWDEPVPEELWNTVAEYCANDVRATEEVFNARKSDFLARQILADVAGMTVNDTTNSLTTKIIFGSNRRPQDQFNYRNLALPVRE
jgi:phage/plasmid-associated DNA primase